MHTHPHLYTSRVEHVSCACRAFSDGRDRQADIRAAVFNRAIQGKFLLQPPFSIYSSGFIWYLLGWQIFSQGDFKLPPLQSRTCPGFQRGHLFKQSYLAWKFWIQIPNVGVYSELGQKRMCFAFWFSQRSRKQAQPYTHTFGIEKHLEMLDFHPQSQGAHERASQGSMWWGQSRQGLFSDAPCVPGSPRALSHCVLTPWKRISSILTSFSLFVNHHQCLPVLF